MPVCISAAWCWSWERGRLFWRGGCWGRPVPRPGSTFCASLRSGNAESCIKYGNLQEKWPRTPPGTLFCVSWCNPNPHGHLARAILYWKLQEICPTRIPRQLFCASLRNPNAHVHFARAVLCAHFRGIRRTRSRALTPSERTSSLWPHCLGNSKIQNSILYIIT